MRKIFAGLIFLLGVFVMVAGIYPMARYTADSRLKYPELLSPVPKDAYGKTIDNYDFTQASNWFEGSKKEDFSSEKTVNYTITIPALGIEKAAATIGGEDLTESLVHFPGTAPPGGVGNSVVFGHSILPIFFNPKNYISIFSTLPTLEKGDGIYVDYDGMSYKFQVEDMFEVRPTDIQILEQNKVGSYMTLVTCTPPGDPRKPKRLVVRAKLVPYSEGSALSI